MYVITTHVTLAVGNTLFPLSDIYDLQGTEASGKF